LHPIDIPKTLQVLRNVNYAGLLALEIDFLHPSYDGEELIGEVKALLDHGDPLTVNRRWGLATTAQ
jgi:hypothetical protein